MIDTLAYGIKHKNFGVYQVIYFVILSFLLCLLCVTKLSIPVKIVMGLPILLITITIEDTFKAFLYLTLFTLALPVTFFQVHIEGVYQIPIGVTDILILLLFFLLIGERFSQRELRFRKDFLTIPLVILLFSALLSLTGAVDRRLGILYLLVMFEGFILYSYILTFFKSEKDLKHLLFIYFAIAGFYGIYGLFQFKLGYFPLVEGTEVGLSSGIWANRVRANLTHANSLSGFIVIVLPLMWVCFSRRKISWNILRYFFIALLCFVLAVTYSRNGYIAFLLSTFVLAFLYSKKNKKPKVFGVFLLGMLVLAVGIARYAPDIFTRLASVKYFQYDAASLGRLMFWRESLKTFTHHPFIGIGVSNFVREPYSLGFLGPHNLYIATLLELGMLGGIGLFFLLFRIFHRLIKVYRSDEPDFRRRLNVGLMASWVAFLSHNFFDSVWGVVSHTRQIKYLWFFLAITMMSINLSRTNSNLKEETKT